MHRASIVWKSSTRTSVERCSATTHFMLRDTLMGHACLEDTQLYLTMMIELLERASLCFEQYARSEVLHV
jgi:hypothetical protein